jgi:hypothetical protein
MTKKAEVAEAKPIVPARAMLEGKGEIGSKRPKYRCRAIGCDPCDEGYKGNEVCEKPKNKPIPQVKPKEEEYKYPADSLIEIAKEMSGSGKKRRKHRRRHY